MNDITTFLTTIIGARATKKLLKGLQQIGDPVYLLRIFSKEELAQYVGDRTAEKLYAALRLGQRVTMYSPNLQTVDSPAKAYALLNLAERPRQETFWVIYLDCLNRVLNVKTLCVGTATETLVDFAELMRCAITLNASKAIVAHNHPSNSPVPSPEDVRLIERLVQAGKLMNLEIMDSLVVVSDTYLSMRENCSHIWNT